MKRIVIAVLLTLPLASCETSGDGSMAAGNDPDASARAACLRDVRLQTGNSTVAVLESSFSQAGTEVIVGVGPQQARWRCIAYSDGTTGGIMSLTDEGSL